MTNYTATKLQSYLRLSMTIDPVAIEIDQDPTVQQKIMLQLFNVAQSENQYLCDSVEPICVAQVSDGVYPVIARSTMDYQLKLVSGD